MAASPIDVPMDAVEFIYSAVEAGWTTPKIAAEVCEHDIRMVFWWARQARMEYRHASGLCEHCRRRVARGNT